MPRVRGEGGPGGSRNVPANRFRGLENRRRRARFAICTAGPRRLLGPRGRAEPRRARRNGSRGGQPRIGGPRLSRGGREGPGRTTHPTGPGRLSEVHWFDEHGRGRGSNRGPSSNRGGGSGGRARRRRVTSLCTTSFADALRRREEDGRRL